jgi:hypothetical protein
MPPDSESPVDYNFAVFVLAASNLDDGALRTDVFDAIMKEVQRIRVSQGQEELTEDQLPMVRFMLEHPGGATPLGEAMIRGEQN